MAIALFPLQKVKETQLHQLGRCLWAWEPCDDCQNVKHCINPSCPLERAKRLARFFDYYREMTALYELELEPDGEPALRSHEDLFEIIGRLKSMPDLTRAELADNLFANCPNRRKPPNVADQERTINLAVRVMTMVNCSAQRLSSGLLEQGAFQIRWRSDVTLNQFIIDAFPMTDHPSLNGEDSPGASVGMKAALTAKKLKKRARIDFRPTDDIRSHLKLDRETSVVEIYHHTAFLKEQLRLTKDQPKNISVAGSLRLGALPRQLVLEALDSVQKILFPLSDSSSRALLQSLVSTSSFDPDCLRFESASIRNADEKDVSYHYFGSRLADLYEELENPTPHGWMEKWLERKSRARHVMLATLIGVVIAIVLGIAALAVSIYQAYIGYQAWQHPVVTS